MAEKKKKTQQRRGLGRGIGALIPENQAEHPARPIDVFFSSPQKEKINDSVSKKSELHSVDSAVKVSGHVGTDNSSLGMQKKNVSRETSHDDKLVPVPGATFGELSVKDIIPNTKQPRQIFDEDELQELSDSIKEVGILQPIVVRPYLHDEVKEDAGRNRPCYELIMGERRWRAAQLAGLTTIPAIVRHTSDSDLLRDALLENLHRTQLNPLEEAAAYQQLLDDFNITQEELSKKIARSRPQISNTLRLLKLPPLVQRRVAAGILSAGHARALLSLDDPAAMEQLAQRIVAEGLSVRNVEEIVAFGGGRAQEKKKVRHQTKQFETELNTLAQRLGDYFNTRVKIQMGAKKGRMSIEFANIDDLNRILAAFHDSGMPSDIYTEIDERSTILNN